MSDYYRHARCIERACRDVDRAPRRRPSAAPREERHRRRAQAHQRAGLARSIRARSKDDPALALRLYDEAVERDVPVYDVARDAVARACALQPVLREAPRAARARRALFVELVHRRAAHAVPGRLDPARAPRRRPAGGDDPGVFAGGRARAPRHLPRVHGRRALGGGGRSPARALPRRARGRASARVAPGRRDGAPERALLRRAAARHRQGHRRARTTPSAAPRWRAPILERLGSPERRHRRGAAPGAASTCACTTWPRAATSTTRTTIESSAQRCTGTRACASSTCSPSPTCRPRARPR